MQGQEREVFWSSLWKITTVLNIFVAVLFTLYFGKRILVYDADIKASDLVVIVLTSVTVILAALALVLGGLAIWGFAEIKRSAEAAATLRAEQTATIVARDVAESATARGLFESEQRLQMGGDMLSSTNQTGPMDDMSRALTDDPES